MWLCVGLASLCFIWAACSFVAGLCAMRDAHQPEDQRSCPFCNYEIGVPDQLKCPECGRTSTPEEWANWSRTNQRELDAAGSYIKRVVIFVGAGIMLLGIAAVLAS